MSNSKDRQEEIKIIGVKTVCGITKQLDPENVPNFSAVEIGYSMITRKAWGILKYQRDGCDSLDPIGPQIIQFRTDKPMTMKGIRSRIARLVEERRMEQNEQS